MKHIEYGIANDGKVTFDRVFSEKPVVIVNFLNPNTELAYSIVITNVTTTGFSYYGKYSADNYNTWIPFLKNVQYVAIGK